MHAQIENISNIDSFCYSHMGFTYYLGCIFVNHLLFKIQKILEHLIPQIINYHLYLSIISLLSIFLILSFLIQKNEKKTLHSIFFSSSLLLGISSFIFGSYLIFFSTISTFIFCLIFTGGFFLTWYFWKKYFRSCFDFFNQNQCIGKCEKALYVFLTFFIFLSLNNAYVPYQYDDSSYNYLGELLFRYKTYPMAQITPSFKIANLTPSGIYFIDYLGRIIINEPSNHVAIIFILFCMTIFSLIPLLKYFFTLNSLHHNYLLILPVFSRGFIWNFWENNIPRKLVDLYSILIAYILCFYFKNKNMKNRSLVSFFIIFTVSSFTHPEQTLYIVGPLLLYLILKYFVHKKEIVYLSLTCLFTSVLFYFWYKFPFSKLFIGITKYYDHLWEVPIPRLSNILVHLNGFFPISLYIVILLYSVLKRKLEKNDKWFFLFCVFLFTCSYFHGLIYTLFPKEYPLILRPFSDFDGAKMYILTKLSHPHSILLKISTYPLLIILIYSWIIQKFDQLFELKSRYVQIFFICLIFDIGWFYYHKPLISYDEYQSILNLKNSIRKDSIIINKLGSNLNYWLGPLTKTTSLPFRDIYTESFYNKTITYINEKPTVLNNIINTIYETENWMLGPKIFKTNVYYILDNQGKEFKLALFNPEDK